MSKTISVRTLGLLVVSLALPAAAEVLELPKPASASAAEPAIALPKRGEVQAKVLKRYGEPLTRHAAVGGGSAAQPLITRWDYNNSSGGFSVFFENDHVVDVVVPDRPAPLFNTDELSAADG